MTSYLLSYAIVGMGAGMDLKVIGEVGFRGIGYTISTISLALFLGYIFLRLFKLEKNLATLITVGTAICGGSAIAAISPVIKAKNFEISIALGTVFILNAIALFTFPPIGHFFNLDQHQFGLWSALAIHDTSSVVGATLQYGKEALEVGTTIKLARAFWIIPLAFGAGFFFQEKDENSKPTKTKKPWFILGFCLTAALVTYFPVLRDAGSIVNTISKQLLVVTLFLIGLNLTRENIKMVGFKPFFYGVSLWIIMGTGTLVAIMSGLIK